jgi:hypothetical protein
LINATSLNDNVGPTFEIEPPIRLDFTNNIGGRLDCVAKGIPHPNVEWFDADNNPVSTIQNVSGRVERVLNREIFFQPREAQV